MVNQHAQRFVTLARKYVGTKEEPVGSNRGTLIDSWNRAVGVPVGSYWCASFVSAVVRDFEAQGFDFPLPQSASCDVWLQNARNRKMLSLEPAVGDLFLVRANATDATHIGIVSGNANETWQTIEGNSNMGGSRNGFEVVERPSGINRNMIVYIHWCDAIEGEIDIPWHVVFPNKTIEAVNIKGSTYIPLRSAIIACDGNDDYLTYDGQPLYRGKKIPCQMVVLNGKTHVPVRQFMAFADLTFQVLPATNTIKVNDDDQPWV